MGKKEDVYDEQISSLMTQIIQICKDNEIGMVMDFELDNDGTEEDPKYLHCTTSLPGLSDQLKRAAQVVAPNRAPQMFRTTLEKADGTKETTLTAFLDN